MSAEYFNDQWRIPNNKNQSLVSNYSMDFNGINDYIDTGAGVGNALGNSVSDMTISMWVNITPGSSNDGIFKIGAIATNVGEFSIRVVTDARIQAYFGASAVSRSYDVLAAGNWNHIAIVKQGTTVSGYVNGSLTTPVPQPNPGNIPSTLNFSNKPTFIGLYWNTSFLFNGKMDQVSVFDYGLSASQVSTLYGGGTAVTNPMSLSPKPIAYYQLGDQSVSTGPTSDYLVPNNSLQDYVFNFDGTDDYIDCGDSNTFSFGNSSTDSPFSISAWIYMDDATQFRIATKSGTNGSEYSLINGSDDKLNFILYDTLGVSGNIRAKYDTALTSYQGQWIHVVGTYSGVNGQNGIELYLNGSLLTTIKVLNSPYTAMPNTTQPFEIGRSASSSYANGKFSNVSVFNTELSSTQVETIYNNGAPNDISSLSPVAWYKLNASEIFNSTSTEWSVDNNAYPSVYESSLDFIPNDYINAGTGLGNSLGTYTGDASVSLWFKADTTISNDGLFSMTPFNGNTFGNLRINISSNILYFVSSELTSWKTIPFTDTTSWHHLVCIFKSGDITNSKIYLDGIDQTTTDVGTFPSSLSMTGKKTIIGGYYGTNNTFDGKMSNVSFFNTALSTPNVQTLYNNGTPALDISSLNPVSWWKLNNTTTGVQDSAGSNDGTNNGATEYAGFVNTLAGESVSMDSSNLVVSDLQQTSGYSPYALDFDGINDFINLGVSPKPFDTTNLTSFSISFWIKPFNPLPTNSIIFDNRTTPFNIDGLALQVYNSQFYVYFTNVGTLIIDAVNNGFSLTDWNHITMTLDGSDPSSSGNATRFNFYINNVPVNGLSLNGNPLVVSSSPFTLMSRNGSAPIPGKLSNFSTFNYPLTSLQVTEIYNSGVPSNLNTFSGTAPVAWWQLGSNSSFNTDWTCLDEIGSNNAVSNGSMTNDDITNGPGYSANGSGTSSIDIKGDAPYSSANGLSESMDVLDRTTDVPS